MTTSSANYYISNILSHQDIKLEDLTIELIDSYFMNLINDINQYILEQNFIIIFDLFEEMFTKECELKQNQNEPILFNNMDFNKILLYEVHTLQVRIIDLLLVEILNTSLDCQNLMRFSPFIAYEMKNFTKRKFNFFINKLHKLRSLNENVIDRYIQIISQQLQILK